MTAASRIGAVVFHWREGRRHGYPRCCVAHFCWDALMGWPASVTRWRQVKRVPTDGGPVACGLLHAGGSPYGLPLRVARIASHQLEHLPLTARGAARREVATCGSTSWREAEAREKSLASREGWLAELYWGRRGRYGRGTETNEGSLR